MNRRLGVLLITFTIAALVSYAGAPARIDFQCKILVQDVPLTGPGYFKFAMDDVNGATNYWANDGVGVGEPTVSITNTVYNGVMSAALGDPDIMNPIDPAIFALDTNLYLRIWFSDDNVTFNEMLPPQQLISAPFAIEASQLGGMAREEIIAAATNGVTLSGDISGTPGGGTTVDSLQGNAVETGSPASGEVLTWDGSAWTNAQGGISGSSASNSFVKKTGDTMTGRLIMNAGISNAIWIDSLGYGIMIGNMATSDGDGVAVGTAANTTNSGGVAIGYQTKANDNGVAVGWGAEGQTYGVVVGNMASGKDYGAAVGWNANATNSGVAVGFQTSGDNEGVAVGNQAEGNNKGVAVGNQAKAQEQGIAVGNFSNGKNTNIAIGCSANCQTGTERIAIGHNVTNFVDNSASLRGKLFLDGGDKIFGRTSFATGAWQQLIPLPDLMNVVFVATNGTPTGPGTIDRPYDTPQNGYNAAAGRYTNVPATVVIAGGTYSGGLAMNAGNIHVLGFSRPQIASLTTSLNATNILGKRRVENIIFSGPAMVSLDSHDVKFHNVRFQNGLSIYGSRVEVQDCYATANDGPAVTVGNGIVPVSEIALYNSSFFNNNPSYPALMVNSNVNFFETIGCEVVNYAFYAAIEDREGAVMNTPHLYSHNVIHGPETGMTPFPAVFDPFATNGPTMTFIQNSVWGDVGANSNSQFYANNIVYGVINNIGGIVGWSQAGVGTGTDPAGNTEHQFNYPNAGGTQRGFPAAWQD